MVGVNAIADALSSETCTLETLWYDCCERKPHHGPRPPWFLSDLAALPYLIKLICCYIAPALVIDRVVATPFPTASI